MTAQFMQHKQVQLELHIKHFRVGADSKSMEYCCEDVGEVFLQIYTQIQGKFKAAVFLPK